MMRAPDGTAMTEESVQVMMQAEQTLTGTIQLACPETLEIGSIRQFCGLPLRVLREVPVAEAREYHKRVEEARIYWPQVAEFVDWHYHYHVEVAD
jgi:hypothetical protein